MHSVSVLRVEGVQRTWAVSSLVVFLCASVTVTVTVTVTGYLFGLGAYLLRDDACHGRLCIIIVMPPEMTAMAVAAMGPAAPLMDWTERETHRDSDFRRES